MVFRRSDLQEAFFVAGRKGFGSGATAPPIRSMRGQGRLRVSLVVREADVS
jgi:hypothetical protein